MPVRGAYLRLRSDRADLVRGNIYPVPDPALPFLGAHLTRRHDGVVLLGPPRCSPERSPGPAPGASPAGIGVTA